MEHMFGSYAVSASVAAVDPCTDGGASESRLGGAHLVAGTVGHLGHGVRGDRIGAVASRAGVTSVHDAAGFAGPAGPAGFAGPAGVDDAAGFAGTANVHDASDSTTAEPVAAAGAGSDAIPDDLSDADDTLAAASGLLRALRKSLFRFGSDDLADLMGELGQLRALGGAAMVAVAAEAESRGVVDQSQCASTSQWIAQAAPACRSESGQIASAAQLSHSPELAPIADALGSLAVDMRTATVIAREYRKLRPDLTDPARPIVLEQLTSIGAEQGPAAVCDLKDVILERYARQDDFEDFRDTCRRQIQLSSGSQTGSGLWKYGLIVDSEGRAILEAVIGPLSAPRSAYADCAAIGPNATGATGESDATDAATATGTPDATGMPGGRSGPHVLRDTRPVGRRRGEALVEALRRSVTATGANAPQTNPKAVLMVTIAEHDLAQQTGTGQILGTRAAGVRLDAASVRKIACDAQIIPAVLGTRSEIVDLGRAERLFTTAQVRALWKRDGQCTFSGCDIPAAWCDAHHLVHWADDGRTDLDNAALLCPRHHTVVHRDRLAGNIIDGRVTWDLLPGSYQHTRLPQAG